MISYIFAIVTFINGIYLQSPWLIFATIGFCFVGALAEHAILNRKRS